MTTDAQDYTLNYLFQKPYVMRMVTRRVPDSANIVAEIYDRDERVLAIATVPPDGIGSVGRGVPECAVEQPIDGAN